MTMIRPTSAGRSSKGFTLIEMMMMTAIIGLLASLAVPKYKGYVEKARIARCIAEIRYIERDITAYFIEREKLPNSLNDLGRSLNNLSDPWGNPYQYLLIAGTKFASNGGEDGTYYARNNWMPNIAATTVGSEKGFWSGSWFVSEAWAAPGGGGGGGGGGGAKPRKDRFLVPINSDYDLYSMGADGESVEPLTAAKSRDDIVRASDGAFVGVAENF